jgi:hypothetical protein
MKRPGEEKLSAGEAKAKASAIRQSAKMKAERRRKIVMAAAHEK